MNPDGVLVLCVHRSISCKSININFSQSTSLGCSISNSPWVGIRDAVFDEIVNKGLDCRNFSSSVGIITEQDIEGNQNPILIIPVHNHKESFK